jgi:hypothetical protein
VSVVLQTEKDRIVEERAMNRIIAARGECWSVRFPEFSLVDYLIGGPDDHTVALALLEIKARKESASQVRSYGGLMLKHRKVKELADIEESLKTPVFAVFPFEDGFGDIYFARPSDLLHKKPKDPPIRRNYRGLACDEEPVVYLDWGTEVLLMVPKEES